MAPTELQRPTKANMATDTALTADFYARADSPIPAQRRKVLERLGALVAEGVLDDVSFHNWPSGVSLEPIEAGHPSGIVETFDRFREWADEREVQIEPPFAVSSYHCRFTGEREERLSVPHMVLAVTGEAGIECVFPHHDGERMISLEEGLERLASGQAGGAHRTEKTNGSSHKHEHDVFSSRRPGTGGNR